MYCAFCGAFAKQPYEYIGWGDQDPEWAYDPTIVQSDCLEWMDDVVLATEDMHTRFVKDRHVSAGPFFDVD